MIWELCGRERVVARRRETLVEGSPSRTGDVRPHEIEDASIRFVGVEAVVQELTQEASALRNAEDVRRSSAHRHVGAMRNADAASRIAASPTPATARRWRGSRSRRRVPARIRRRARCARRGSAMLKRHFSRGTRVGVVPEAIAHRQRCGAIVAIDGRIGGQISRATLPSASRRG